MWTFAAIVHGLLAAALLLASCLQSVMATEDDVTPRISFPYNAKERSAKRFSVDGVFNYTSLLLSQEDDMLYVGAREALFALSLSDISKTKLQKNLTWGTPAGKREECSFKGKNLEVRGTLTAPAKQEIIKNTSEKYFTISKA